MGRRWMFRLAVAIMAPVILTGCIDELSEIFTIIAFSESDDPDVRRSGELIANNRERIEVNDLVDKFLETGDESNLDSALQIRPDDTELLAFKVALATLGGDPTGVEAAKKALALAESKRIASFLQPGATPITAANIRRNVLDQVLVAQTKMLGGALFEPWDPPSEGAGPGAQQLFVDYCATRNEIMTQFGDSFVGTLHSPGCP